MTDIQINNPPGATDRGGSGLGVVVGVILAVVVILALLWFFAIPRTGRPATTAPAGSGPTINVNNPPSQPAPVGGSSSTSSSSSSQPAQPAAGSNTSAGTTFSAGSSQPAQPAPGNTSGAPAPASNP